MHIWKSDEFSPLHSWCRRCLAFRAVYTCYHLLVKSFVSRSNGSKTRYKLRLINTNLSRWKLRNKNDAVWRMTDRVPISIFANKWRWYRPTCQGNHGKYIAKRTSHVRYSKCVVHSSRVRIVYACSDDCLMKLLLANIVSITNSSSIA